MPIVVHLKSEIARRGIKQGDLAQAIDLSPVNLSRMATNRIKAIRFATLEGLCRELDCTVGDLLKYEPRQQETPQDATGVADGDGEVPTIDG